MLPFYFMGDLFSQDYTLGLIGKSLSTLAQRQKVLSNNIANVDTPGYKRSDVDFQGVLRSAISSQDEGRLGLMTTNPGHISLQKTGTTPAPVMKDVSSTYRKDGNNVDIEKEVVEANKNALMYNSAVKFADTHFSLLKLAIEEGG